MAEMAVARFGLVLAWLVSAQVLATQVHRFETPTRQEQQVLKQFARDHPRSEEWDTVPGSHVDLMIHDHDQQHAARLPLQRSVFIESVENLIETSEKEEHGASDFHGAYHSSDDYHVFMHRLAQNHPNAKLVTLGKSVLGKPIVGLRIGDFQKPEIMFQGTQHAREWIAAGSLAYAAEQLVSAKDILRDHSVLVVPVANPDGYDFSRHGDDSRMWRKNMEGYTESLAQLGDSADACYGTDLNRNWATGKRFPNQELPGEEVSDSVCDDTYQGRKPMSESEVQSLSRYIQHRQKQTGGISTFVDVHSYSQKIIPVGCNNQDLSEATREGHLKLTQQVADAMTKVHGQEYTTGECSKVMYPCSGVAHDYAHFNAKVPSSMAIELRDKGQYGFIVPPGQIKQVGQEVLAAVHAIAKASSEKLMQADAGWKEALNQE